MFNPAQIDTTIIVAIITGVVSLIVSLIGFKAKQKSDDAEAFKSMQETIEGLHRDITAQDKRIGFLSHLVISEQEQRRQAEASLLEEKQKTLENTAYLRALGHWFEGLCEVLDPVWLKAHPKPRLPDSIRPEISALTVGTDLEINHNEQEGARL